MKKYTFGDFTEIINMLRSENGCPWDREQTHESLKPCMTEEAYELLSSINIYYKSGYYENMREELGDILLQVVMHSQIASEEGLFSVEDVIQEICEKMIRRHPHVFGNVIAKDSEKVLTNWDDIKSKEKEGKEWITSPLREIPEEFPSLIRAPKVLKKIDKLYTPMKSYEDSVRTIIEESENLPLLSLELESARLEKSLGNILIELSNISRLKRIPLEQLLSDKLEELINDCEQS